MTTNLTLSSPAPTCPDTSSWVSDQDLDAFREGYARAMLAHNAIDGDSESVDASGLYISPGSWWLRSPVSLTEADQFLRAYLFILQEVGDGDMKVHGADFALTRNHHGDGFWARGYGDVGDRLTVAAHAYGEVTVELDADGDVDDVEVGL